MWENRAKFEEDIRKVKVEGDEKLEKTKTELDEKRKRDMEDLEKLTSSKENNPQIEGKGDKNWLLTGALIVGLGIIIILAITYNLTLTSFFSS